MSKDDRPFVDRFFESGHKPFIYDGRLVHYSVRVPVGQRKRVSVHAKSAIKRPLQAICIATNNCLLKFGGKKSKSATCWIEYVPIEFEAEIVNAKPDAELIIWHAVESGHRNSIYGIGDMGMLVELVQESKDHILIRCNSGVDTKKDFKSLVFELEVI